MGAQGLRFLKDAFKIHFKKMHVKYTRLVEYFDSDPWVRDYTMAALKSVQEGERSLRDNDFAFPETRDRSHFQGRYILRHPWR